MKKILLISATAAMLLFTGCGKTQVKNEIDAKKYDQLTFVSTSTAAGEYEFISPKNGLNNNRSFTLNSENLVQIKAMIKKDMSDNIITNDEYDKILNFAQQCSEKNLESEKSKSRAILKETIK